MIERWNVIGWIKKYRTKFSYSTLLLGGFALLASAFIAIGDRVTRAAISERLAEDLQMSLAQVVPPALHDNDLLQDTVTVGAPGLQVYRARRDDKVQAVAYELSGAGYGGSTIVLVMAVDANGKVLGVRVVSHAETPGLGDKLELSKSDWILSFNGRSLGNPPEEDWAVKKDGGEFDQFTGATITPRTVVSVVKQGLEFFAAHRAELLDKASDVGSVSPPAAIDAAVKPAAAPSKNTQEHSS
jgi:electron transport complex protein RnfG